ncbi:YwiC-like family protein [Actinoplanes ianthinogenes]|uniref:YwiC-like family protein n=1 Tax=Actinoplanes ianthinogenes TaxID=122358 RepID=UPI00166FDAF0
MLAVKSRRPRKFKDQFFAYGISTALFGSIVVLASPRVLCYGPLFVVLLASTRPVAAIPPGVGATGEAGPTATPPTPPAVARRSPATARQPGPAARLGATHAARTRAPRPSRPRG